MPAIFPIYRSRLISCRGTSLRAKPHIRSRRACGPILRLTALIATNKAAPDMASGMDARTLPCPNPTRQWRSRQQRRQSREQTDCSGRPDTLGCLQSCRATNGFSRMPPLATTELDQTAIALLGNWITTALPARQSYDQWRLTTFGSSTSPDGDPAADPDGDGRNNAAEFLALTNPLSGGSFLTPQIAVGFGKVTISFQAPANRWVVVETSTDLRTWSTWDTPGNSGNLLNGTNIFTDTPVGSRQFFRLRLQEN